MVIAELIAVKENCCKMEFLIGIYRKTHIQHKNSRKKDKQNFQNKVALQLAKLTSRLKKY